MEKDTQQFNKLVEEVENRKNKYEDFYEIAAYLESAGWNDTRVLTAFGASSVFELSEQIFEIIKSRFSLTSYVPEEKEDTFKVFLANSKNFLRGLIFALPMAISIIAMLSLKFSLWSYQYLTTDLATSIAIGTILSFMTVGGFTQAIARRVFFYMILGYYSLARKITFTFVMIGYITIFLISSLMLLSSAIVQFFPYKILVVAVLYFIFLSSIWLSVTVMYVLRKELSFTGLITLGIILVFVFFKLFQLDIIVSQLISLFIVTICCLALVILFFKNAEKKMEKGIAPKMPKLSVTFYTVKPYFAYGFLYFTFIYIDRVVAWSSNDSIYMPYILWFRGNYELGLDFALFALMVPMGFIEVIINSMMKKMELLQNRYSIDAEGEMNSIIVKDYKKSLIKILILSIISSASIYLIMRYIDVYKSNILGFKIFENPTIHFVLVAALISYAILSGALMNAVLLFSLSQPQMINKLLLTALLINIAVGFAASRWFSWWADNMNHYKGMFGVEGYAFAVLGLVAGSIYFFVTSCKSVFVALEKLDYCLYSIS